MTPDFAAGVTEELTFRHHSGTIVHAVATGEEQENCAGELLTARGIRLADGTRLRQVRVTDGPQRGDGYGRLDNEILAGRRLHAVAEPGPYPASVSFLHGDEAESATPYALLRPYQGKPLSAVAGHMLEAEQRAFELSLLSGLCWLAAAGIAHRGLSSSTVRWDHQEHAQITDFSRCTVFGAPRSVTSWLEEADAQPGPGKQASGPVTPRDDMYTAGLLIYYVRSQGDTGPPSHGRLTELGLAGLEPVFGPPESRPSASELLASYLGMASPVTRRTDPLKDGHSRFEFWRDKKSSGREFPADRR
jgi:hypothetical protein